MPSSPGHMPLRVAVARLTAIALLAAAAAVARAHVQFVPPITLALQLGGGTTTQASSSDIACQWGRRVELRASQPPRPDCGKETYEWSVFSQASGEAVPLGAAAAAPKLVLTLAPPNVQAPPGALRQAGTYTVQGTLRTERCAAAQVKARINVGACPPAPTDAATVALQQCSDITEPGKRRLTLGLAPSDGATDGATWSLLPSFSISGVLGASASVASDGAKAGGVAGSGAVLESASAPSVACQPVGDAPGRCVVFVGSGKGRLQPGRAYSVKLRGAPPQQQQPQQAASFSLGWGVDGLSLGGSSAVSASGSAPERQQTLEVPKCPPRITRSVAGLMGRCGDAGGRWLELQASAVDLEEGPGAALKLYWYVLSSRTQDVVLEAGGQLAKLPIGRGAGQLPDGRSYAVKLVVVGRSGDAVASATRTQVSGVLQVPPC